MSDSVKDSIFSGVFHDSFTNVAGYGWSAGGSGVGEYENGIFSVRTEPRQYYYRYVDLLLKQFDLILVISRIAGPSGSSYGIFLREPLDDTSYSDRLFGIDAPGRYAICRADSLDKGIHGIVDSGILCSGECDDTLKLSGEKDRTIHFLINGDTVQTISRPEIIHGAGFFTGDSQHVHFNSFFLKAYSDSISSMVIRKSAGIQKNPVFTKQSSGTIDILGRTLQMKDRELIEKSGNRNRIVIITKKGEGDHPQPFILLP